MFCKVDIGNKEYCGVLDIQNKCLILECMIVFGDGVYVFILQVGNEKLKEEIFNRSSGCIVYFFFLIDVKELQQDLKKMFYKNSYIQLIYRSKEVMEVFSFGSFQLV